MAAHGQKCDPQGDHLAWADNAPERHSLSTRPKGLTR